MKPVISVIDRNEIEKFQLFAGVGLIEELLNKMNSNQLNTWLNADNKLIHITVTITTKQQ